MGLVIAVLLVPLLFAMIAVYLAAKLAALAIRAAFLPMLLLRRR
jgi:hypothetical protein